MKKKERKEYIKAVKCLFDLPSVSRDFAEGARTRHDDFVATHINQTRQIHQTVRIEVDHGDGLRSLADMPRATF